jgi:acetyl esterase/lipase
VSNPKPSDRSTTLFGELSAWVDAEGGHVETLGYGDPSQVLDLTRPARDGRQPLVLVLHGGFWRAEYGRSTTAALAVALTIAGFATANVEYRRVGPGTFRPMLDDILAARQNLNGVPGIERVVAFGHSAGGHLALWLASCGGVAGAVALGSRTSRLLSESGWHARRYAECAGEECRLVEFDGVDHFDVIDPRRAAWPAVRAAVGSVLA